MKSTSSSKNKLERKLTYRTPDRFRRLFFKTRHQKMAFVGRPTITSRPRSLGGHR